MSVQQSAIKVLMGEPPRRRTHYLLAAVGVTLVVTGFNEFVIPGWADTYIWVVAGIGILIAASAGAGNYGLLSGLCGTGLYVAAIGQSEFLLSTSVEYPLVVIVPRLLIVLAVATAAIAIPGYLVGVGARTLATRTA